MIRTIQKASLPMVKIALITPYKAQVNKMKDELASMIKRDEINMRELLQTVEINTIDGFQGREVDVVFFSCVRTNDQGYIGFVSDDRRLNVGLTRAKKCLIIVGNGSSYALERNASWSALVQSLKERRFFQKVQLPYNSLL
jgi:senataxin